MNPILAPESAGKMGRQAIEYRYCRETRYCSIDGLPASGCKGADMTAEH
jgi:hypothetical protein